MREQEVVRLDGDTWGIRVVVENSGWLPTNVTQKAIERKIVRPVEAEILLPDGVELIGAPGDRKKELGQLSGRIMKNNLSLFGGGSDNTTDRAKAEWIVRGSEGTTIPIELRHQRAGTARTEVTCGAMAVIWPR